MAVAKAAPNTIGAILLVTGCCIGAGMIGLPVMSALAGFLPSTLSMIICYLFTTLTGLLLLEATLWFEKPVNLPSIVDATLGKFGKALTLILFLSLFYCLFVAYLDGGGALFADFLSGIFRRPVSREAGVFTCLLIGLLFSYAGTHAIDKTNRGLIIGLIISYGLLIAIGLPKVNESHLHYVNWTATLGVVPILLISFGYHNLVPSLTYYLQKNVKSIRYAIIIGNLIPFFIYFLWNFVILGLVSPDAINLQKQDMATEMLQHASTYSILNIVKAFSLFAILTSFLPNAVSFVDFLKDGFKQFNLESRHPIWIYSLVFLPPLACTLFYPHLFLQALGFAGGFIDVLLFGVLPALVILLGRKKYKTASYQVIGGNVTPFIILLLSIGVLILKFH